MQKLLKGRGILTRGDAVSLGIFSSWGVATVTTVTFNYLNLNVGVSPSFHCTVLVPVYRMYTSCYRLHTSCLHDAGVTSCFSVNMWS